MNFSKNLTKTYAKSLFQNLLTQKKEKDSKFNLGSVVSGEGSLKNPSPIMVAEELLLLGTLVTLSKDISYFFTNPTNSEKKKKEFLLLNFPGLTLPMKSFLEILSERGHLFLLPQISQEYSKLLTTLKKSTKVKIVTASKFPKKELGKKLLSELKNLTKANEIILTFSYNPKLLGGFLVEYNSFIIDASILKEFSLFFNEI